MHLRFLIFALLLFASPGIVAQEDPGETKTPSKANKRPADKPEPPSEPYDKATVEEMTKCVSLDTAKGIIEVEMFPFTAPNTVRNFLNLTAIGAFDNTTFSRIVPKFVIQGGDLYTNKNLTYEMSVRAHKKLADEPNIVKHERGIISMARGDETDSASTSFFILVDDADYLDDKFAAFGRVVKGMDLVDLINKMPVEDEAPKEPVLVSKALVKECDAEREEIPSVIPPEPKDVPKPDERARFGFRGAIKSVRESTFELKGKKKDWRKSDQHSIGESLTEFGPAGEFIRMELTQKGETVINTNEYSSEDSMPDFTFKDVLRDTAGGILSEHRFKRSSVTTLEYVSYDKSLKVYKRGSIETNADGRILREEFQEFDAEGKIEGSFITTKTYDAYGFMTSRIQVDGKGKQVFYNRYEYPELDDKANWIERLVFDSEDSSKPIQVVTRVFVYYEEK